MLSNSRTADIKVVAEQTRSERAKHTARNAQREGDLYELKANLIFSRRRNNSTDVWYSILSDELNLLKSQNDTGGLCSDAMAQRLALVPMEAEMLID